MTKKSFGSFSLGKPRSKLGFNVSEQLKNTGRLNVVASPLDCASKPTTNRTYEPGREEPPILQNYFKIVTS